MLLYFAARLGLINWNIEQSKDSCAYSLPLRSCHFVQQVLWIATV